MTSSSGLVMSEEERLFHLEALVAQETGAYLSLSHTDDKGVYVSANADLKSDTEICEAPAIGPMPECDYATLVCDSCYKAPPKTTDWFQDAEALPIICSDCVSISYCSETCQLEGVNRHTKDECRSFDYIRTSYRTAVRQHRRRARQLIRLMLLRLSESAEDRKHYKQLSLLCNHYNAHSEDQIAVLDSLATMAVETLAVLDIDLQPTDHIWAMRMLMAINCNQFGMQRECDGQVFATAVYLIPSLFNHNCSPNVSYRSVGTNLVLRTNQPVLKGAELQHSYLQRSNLRAYEARSQALRTAYFFDCACALCVDRVALPPLVVGDGGANAQGDSSGDEAGCYWNSDLSDSD